MLKMYKLKKSISLQQALAKNLLSSFADPPGSTPFPPAHCAIKKWNGNVIVQANTEASVDGHCISLISVVMASPHIYSPGALPYCAADKVIALLRESLRGVHLSKAWKDEKAVTFETRKKRNAKAILGSCSRFLKDSCKWHLLHTNRSQQRWQESNKQTSQQQCQEKRILLPRKYFISH